MGKKLLLLEKIKKTLKELPKQQKIVAEYFLKHPYKIPFLTAAEISKQLGVSSPTIIRLSRKLGYKGFPDLQNDFYKMTYNDITPWKQIHESFEQIDDKNDILAKVIQFDTKNIQNIYTKTMQENFKLASREIHKSKKVYIIGLRSSYSLAYYFSFLLNQIHDNVDLLPKWHESIYDELYEIKEDEVIILISFPRYTRKTVDIAKYARKKGSRIIALTDSPTSPIAQIADISLFAVNSAPFYSFTSAMTILNALIVAISKQNSFKAKEKLINKNKLLKEQNIYI